MSKVEKASYPTSKYSALCDHFDSILEVGLHRTDAQETKILITLGDVDKKPKSLSLYREDAEMLHRALGDLLYYAQCRSND